LTFKFIYLAFREKKVNFISIAFLCVLLVLFKTFFRETMKELKNDLIEQFIVCLDNDNEITMFKLNLAKSSQRETCVKKTQHFN
jgi:hypothetical protein